jgi:hypothetical protein
MQKFSSHFVWSSSSRAAVDEDSSEYDSDADEERASEYDDAPKKFAAVLRTLQRPSCKLGEKTRRDLPSPMRVSVTFRNINWLLRYWSCVQPRRAGEGEERAKENGWDYTDCYPDPICPEYGFKTVAVVRGRVGGCGKKKKNGASKNKGRGADAEDDQGERDEGEQDGKKQHAPASSSAVRVKWMDEDEDGGGDGDND